MQKFFLIIIITFFSTYLSFGQDVYISEIKYTGVSTGIRVVGNGEINLSGFSVVFYKKGRGQTYVDYKTVNLEGNLDNSDKWFEISEISGGSGEGNVVGVALMQGGSIIELFGYKGNSGSNFTVTDDNNVTATSVYVGRTTGEESIQRTGIGGEWGIDAPINQRTASVTKNQIEDFNVYPNPVRDGIFTISTKNSFDKHVLIYSILGSVVYEKTVKPNEMVNVKNLSVGMYLVQVEENEKVSIKKLLIN